MHIGDKVRVTSDVIVNGEVWAKKGDIGIICDYSGSKVFKVAFGNRTIWLARCVLSTELELVGSGVNGETAPL